MKKTKIICTLGPRTDDDELMRSLVQKGMDIARFNFSHGTHEEQKARMDRLKRIRDEEGKPIAILLDTKGPEIRTGILKDGRKVMLSEGDTFVLTAEELTGDAGKVSITYEGLVDDVQVGSTILIDDGLIGLRVKAKNGREIVCTVVNGGELGERKGVNVPNVPVRLPAITEKDREDIRFGAEQQIDFIAASFVRNAECILEIRAFLKECKAPNIPIIAKIENAEGIKNIDEIIRCADGIMIARGDLGVEIPAEEVPYLQKMIIQKCNENYKPVITATQMLDSMMRNPRPTRAEVTDVANAVYDGTDAVMLSGETAMGKYPIEALKMMATIVEDTESHLDYTFYRSRHVTGANGHSISNAVCYSSVATAHDLGAKVIVAPSISGYTTKMLSKWRPGCQIMGMSPSMTAVRQMMIYWGVKPVWSRRAESTDELIENSLVELKELGIVEKGDITVITAGIVSYARRNEPATQTNIMQVVPIE